MKLNTLLLFWWLLPSIFLRWRKNEWIQISRSAAVRFLLEDKTRKLYTFSHFCHFITLHFYPLLRSPCELNLPLLAIPQGLLTSSQKRLLIQNNDAFCTVLKGSPFVRLTCRNSCGSLIFVMFCVHHNFSQGSLIICLTFTGWRLTPRAAFKNYIRNCFWRLFLNVLCLQRRLLWNFDASVNIAVDHWSLFKYCS